jgi:membrane protein implicated in regulation of membrane protease activity
VSDVPSWAIWVAVGLAALGIEAMSLDFVLLYFGVGALITAIAAAVGGNPAVQAVVFALSSVVLLLVSRPSLKRLANRSSDVATNVHTVAGKRGIVTIAIDNDASTGQIRIGTEYWTARSAVEGGEEIPVGAKVHVHEVVGVTARVSRTDES